MRSSCQRVASSAVRSLKASVSRQPYLRTSTVFHNFCTAAFGGVVLLKRAHLTPLGSARRREEDVDDDARRLERLDQVAKMSGRLAALDSTRRRQAHRVALDLLGHLEVRACEKNAF